MFCPFIKDECREDCVFYDRTGSHEHEEDYCQIHCKMGNIDFYISSIDTEVSEIKDKI